MPRVAAADTAAVLLLRARRHRQWSQAEFARRAGIPASQLCAYETSTKQPSAEMLARLLGVAGLDLLAATPDADRARQGRELVDALTLVDAMVPPEAVPEPSGQPPERAMFGPFTAIVRR